MSGLAEFFSGFGPWNWMILAAALLVLELIAPGIYLMWFGVAALLTGVAAFLLPLSWQYELVLFSALSLLALFGARTWLRDSPIETDRPFLNKRAEQYAGQTFVLADAIVDGRGKAQVGDTLWTVSGPDAPRGAVVRVVGADGNVLKVVAAENRTDAQH